MMLKEGFMDLYDEFKTFHPKYDAIEEMKYENMNTHIWNSEHCFTFYVKHENEEWPQRYTDR